MYKQLHKCEKDHTITEAIKKERKAEVHFSIFIFLILILLFTMLC